MCKWRMTARGLSLGVYPCIILPINSPSDPRQGVVLVWLKKTRYWVYLNGLYQNVIDILKRPLKSSQCRLFLQWNPYEADTMFVANCNKQDTRVENPNLGRNFSVRQEDARVRLSRTRFLFPILGYQPSDKAARL